MGLMTFRRVLEEVQKCQMQKPGHNLGRLQLGGPVSALGIEFKNPQNLARSSDAKNSSN